MPDRIFVRFADDGRSIRKWDFAPFEGAQAFVPAVDGFVSMAEASARGALRMTASTIRDTAAEIGLDGNQGALETSAALVGIAEAIDEGSGEHG